MDLYEVMRTTGSTRRFLTDPVPDALLHRVLDNARFAASGGNRQGWRVVIVKDPDLRARLAELYRQQPVPQPSRIGLSDGTTQRWMSGARQYSAQLHELPVQVIVVVDMSALHITDTGLDRPSIIGGASIYPFVQNILLGLRHEGLGASLTTRVVRSEPAVRELLRIPEGFAVAAQLGVGWPARPFPTRLRRRPVDEFATFDTFSGPRMDTAELTGDA
jgi:nitroreductase